MTVDEIEGIITHRENSSEIYYGLCLSKEMEVP